VNLIESRNNNKNRDKTEPIENQSSSDKISSFALDQREVFMTTPKLFGLGWEERIPGKPALIMPGGQFGNLSPM